MPKEIALFSCLTAFRTILNALPITGPLLAPFEFAATMRTDFWRKTVLSFRFHR